MWKHSPLLPRHVESVVAGCVGHSLSGWNIIACSSRDHSQLNNAYIVWYVYRYTWYALIIWNLFTWQSKVSIALATMHRIVNNTHQYGTSSWLWPKARHMLTFCIGYFYTLLSVSFKQHSILPVYANVIRTQASLRAQYQLLSVPFSSMHLWCILAVAQLALYQQTSRRSFRFIAGEVSWWKEIEWRCNREKEVRCSRIIVMDTRWPLTGFWWSKRRQLQ